MNSLNSQSSPVLSRRDLVKYAGVGGLAVVGSSLLSACAGEGGDGSSPAPTGSSAPLKKGGTMRIGLQNGGASSSFSPHTQFQADGQFVGVTLYEPIRAPDANLEMANMLGESLEPGRDGSQWIIKVKQDIEFHNGKTLDAEDVVFSYNLIRDPENAALSYSVFQAIESIKAVDKYTVQIDLKEPSGYFPLALSQRGTAGIVPVGWTPDQVIGTGPFKFVERQGDTTVMARFDNYYGDVALLDGYELIPIVDPNARVNALTSGAVDMIMELPITQVDRFKNDSRFGVIDAPSGFCDILFMRTDEGPFADPDVRKAIQLAVDREQVLEVVYGGHGVIASDVYGKYDNAFDPSLVRTRDVDAAKALIEKAGAKDLPVTFVTQASREDFVQIVAQAANDVGLKADVDVKDQASYFDNFPGWYAATDGVPAIPFMSVAAIFDAPGSFYNGSFFEDAEYTAAWNEAVAALTEEEQKAPIQKMQQILFDRGGYVIPVFRNTLAARVANTGGWPETDQLGIGIETGMNTVGFTA